jgi:hypothetical protein
MTKKCTLPRCLCGAVFVLDKQSHICADEIERLSMRVIE